MHYSRPAQPFMWCERRGAKIWSALRATWNSVHKMKTAKIQWKIYVQFFPFIFTSSATKHPDNTEKLQNIISVIIIIIIIIIIFINCNFVVTRWQ
jgi:hypothetical protein